MNQYTLKNDVKVFGKQVKTFPNGIGETFEELINKTGDCASERNYYGISSMENGGKIIYLAVAEEKYEGEAKKYGFERFAIEKGEYLTKTVNEWPKKTDTIGDVFHDMMTDNRVDKTKPCVEWYKNDDEMWCMVRSK